MRTASVNNTVEPEERQVVQLQPLVPCLKYRNHVKILSKINRGFIATEETAEVHFNTCTVHSLLTVYQPMKAQL